MSDISIPGVSSKIDTSKIVGDLMKVERIPLDRLQDRAATEKKERDGWLEVNRNIASVRDAAKKLYSFDNPFEDKVATSTDESVLSATATRVAQTKDEQITVEKIATADSFLSSPQPNGFGVPAGTYGFQVGSKTVEMQFGGGSLSDFAQFLTQHSNGLLEATVVNDTPSTQVFAVRSKVTGAANTLSFTDDSVQFGLNAGLIAATGGSAKTVELTPQEMQPWTKPLDPQTSSLANGVLTLKTGGEVALPLTPPMPATSGLVLEMTVTVTDLPQTGGAATTAPPGPAIPATGGIDYQGLQVQSSPSESPLPPWNPPAPPTRVDDLGVLSISDGSKTVQLPNVADIQGPQTIQVPLSDYVQNLNSINIRNNNTYRTIQVSGIKVYNPHSRGQYSPAHAISQAGDAEINFDGIDVKRGTNTVDDLLPGVTLNLQAPSPKPVTLSVGPDTKKIKDAIIAFVGNYNKLLTTIEIDTNLDPQVIDEITYFSQDERTAAKQKLGMFEGDITLEQLKSHLEEIMMDPYKTDLDRQLSLLAQAGISTDISNGPTAFDITKLRGYLEIDEGKLDQVLADHPNAVRQLFGNDTNGDLVINSGAAYENEKLLQGFNDPGGVISDKLVSYDQEIASTNQDIATMKDKLDEKEQELKDKYSTMEGTINTLQQNSRSLQAVGGGQQQSAGGASP